MEIFRDTRGLVMPEKSFDVANIAQAFNCLGFGPQIGKVAISFENPDSAIRVSGLRLSVRNRSNIECR